MRQKPALPTKRTVKGYTINDPSRNRTKTLELLGRAQNKFQDPAKLRRLLVDLLDKENWSIMSAAYPLAHCAAFLVRTALAEPYLGQAA